MTHMLKAAVAAMTTTLFLSGQPMTAQSGQDLFQRALAVERADGNVKQAIQLYEEIVNRFETTDRALTARTLVQLGQAYERLGSNEARKRYERVLAEFGEQAEAAARARTRLSTLNDTFSSAVATQRLVWNLTRDVGASKVSFDGRYLAYVDMRDWNLFVRNLASGASRQVTNTARTGGATAAKDQQFASDAILSRDSHRVAFNWWTNDGIELRIADLSGSGVPQARVVYRNDDVDWISPFDWSPDGSRIVVALSRKDRSVQLATIVVASGSPTVLKTLDWQGAAGAAFSPDGRLLAFDAPGPSTRSRDIFVMTAEGAREFTAVRHAGDDALMGWTPDGRGLLFVSEREGAPSLWLQAVTGTSATGSAELLRRNVGNAYGLGVTNRGALYSLIQPVSARNVKVMGFDFTTGKTVPVRGGVLTDIAGINADADWSRDGKQLVYVTRREGVGGRVQSVLGTRSVENGLRREYHLDLENLYLPTFSPDGQRVVVVGYTRAGRQAAHIIDLTTGGQQTAAVAGADERLLGPAGPATAPAWNDSGEKLYYRRVGTSGFRLFEYEVDTRNEREIFAGPDPGGNATLSVDRRKLYHRRLSGPSDRPMDMQEAAFLEYDLETKSEREILRRFSLGAITLSPDGKYILTGSVAPSGQSRSMIAIRVADGTVRELLRSPRVQGRTPVTPVAWAPDSQSVLLRKAPAADGPVEVWWAPLDGREARQVFTTAVLGRTRVHPDGRHVFFDAADSPPAAPEVWVLEDFLPARRPDSRVRPNR
jgi:Tol biopolymer transport system component